MGKAILSIDLDFLHKLLELPKDCQILAIDPQMQQRRIGLLLESQALPEREQGQPFPDAIATISVQRHPEDREFEKRSVRVEACMPKAQEV
jgi:hypothetical protein